MVWGTSKEITTEFIPISDRDILDEVNGREIYVESIEVTFVGTKFDKMVVRGLSLDTSAKVERIYAKKRHLPDWAIPWSVYGAHELA